jgi:hypothetical protein
MTEALGKQFLELTVASRREFGRAINLAGKHGPDFEHLASFASFLGSNGTSLGAGPAPNASLSPSHVQRHHLMAEIHWAIVPPQAASDRQGARRQRTSMEQVT